MKKKLFINYILCLLIGILITGGLSLAFIKNIYKNNIEDKLKTNANLINNTLQYYFYNKDSHKNYFLLSQLISKQISGEVTFFKEDGTVLADSHNNSIMFEKYKNKNFEKALSKDENTVYEDYNDFAHQNYLYILIPPSKYIPVVTRIGVSLKDFYKINRIFWTYILLAIFIGIIIALIIGYFFLDNVIKPLEYLNDAAKTISNGKFNYDIQISSDDELKDLALSINKISYKVNSTISQLDYKNSELNSILNSIIHGVIALDINLNILLINPSFKKMFNLKDLQNSEKSLKDLCFFNNLKPIIDKTINSKKPQEDKLFLDINGEKKVLKVNTNIINSNKAGKMHQKEGIIIIFEDITVVHKFESLRNDFVSNVTHELKTPLTIINGFIETLMEKESTDKEKTQRYLNIIFFESKRLMKLIDDILFLSKIKNYNSSSEIYKINIYKEIDFINDLFVPIASKKNIHLDIDIKKNFNLLVNNKDWFRQMMINLVDNAIKYTPENGQVKIIAYKSKSNIVLKIRDTGVGIPEKDLPRIFERFYRVDKSRSKKAGGTGLGLAIVKHIVVQLNGEISVISKYNLGTEFTIKLPLNIGR